MPQARSPSKVVEGRQLVVEGVVCRESNHVDLLVNKRWMQLLGPGSSPAGRGGAPEPPVLASFRHRGDAEPSKVWELTRNCSMTDVTAGKFHLRVDTSTLVAIVASKYTEVEMVSEGALNGCVRVYCLMDLVGWGLQAGGRCCGLSPSPPYSHALLLMPSFSLYLPLCRSSPSTCTLATPPSLRPSRCGSASRARSRRRSGTARWQPPSGAWSGRAAAVSWVLGVIGCWGSAVALTGSVTAVAIGLGELCCTVPAGFTQQLPHPATLLCSAGGH